MSDTYRGIYRGWIISYYRPPIPCRHYDWVATHPDYEPGHTGHVSAPTVKDLYTEIDEWEFINQSEARPHTYTRTEDDEPDTSLLAK